MGYGNCECALRSGVVSSSTATRRHHCFRYQRRPWYRRCGRSAIGRTLSPLREQFWQICQKQPSKCDLAPPESFRLRSGQCCFAHGRQSAAVSARNLFPSVETCHRAPCQCWGCRVRVLLRAEAGLVRPSPRFEVERLYRLSPERKSTPRRERLPTEQDWRHRSEDISGLQCQRLRCYAGRLARPYQRFLRARFLFVCPTHPAAPKTLRTRLCPELRCRTNG